jgi:hypothetical protein
MMMMSKSNDTTKPRELTEDHRPLADSELDAVSGGAFPIVMAQMALLRGSGDGVNLSEISISKLFDAATP